MGSHEFACTYVHVKASQALCDHAWQKTREQQPGCMCGACVTILPYVSLAGL